MIAIQLCLDAHEGQLDKAGKPYVLHPLRVAFSLWRTSTEDTMITALLHDVVEDTDITLEDLKEYFGEVVADAVDGLTRREGETYTEFILRCKLNPISRQVKLADISDNTRPERIACLPESEQGIVKRYEKAKTVLEAL
jgi:hypothetical protein